MPKYFDEGGNEVTLDSLQVGAEISNMELDQYMQEFGFTAEGKTPVPEETTPPMEPEKMTAAGDSSLADTSLESLEGNPVQKALKRLSAVNISDEYKFLEENVDVPIVNQVMRETPTGIMMPTGETYETFVYDEFKEQAKNKLGEKASEEDILKEAKSMYLSTAKSDLFNAKVEEIMEDFDDEIYTPMARLNKYFSFLAPEETGEAAEQKKLLQEEIKKSEARAFEQLEKLADNKLAQEAYLETSATRLNEIVAKSEKDPESITEEEAEEYKNLSQSYQNVYNTYKETVDELGKTIETGQTLQELVDLTARSYDNVDVVVGRVSSAALNAVGNILNFTAELSPEVVATRIIGGETQGYVPIYGMPGQITPGQVKFMGDALVSEAEKITNKVEKRQELSKVNSVEDFAEFALDLFSEQAVNTAITAGVPHVGLGLIAASASGEKFRNMQFEIEELGEKITPLRFYTAGVMYGAGEYITEKIALDQFLGAKKALKKSFDFAKTPLTQSPTTTLSALSKWGTGLNQEGMAELGSQLISNFADKAVLDKNVSLWDGIGEAYLSGAVMSGLGFGAPALMTDVYHAATTGNEQAAAGRRSARIIEIRKRVDDIYKTSDINDPGVQEALDVLNQEADGLIIEQLKAMKVAEARVDELSRADKRKLLNIDSELWKVKGRADKINANENLTDAEKKPILAKLASEAAELEASKDVVLAKSEASKSKAKAKAFQIRTAASKDLKFTYINGKDTNDAFDKAIKAVEESDIDDDNKTKLLNQLKAGKSEAQSGEFDIHGTYEGAEFGFPLAITTDTGSKANRSVAAHEVSHATLFKKLLEGNADIIGLAKDLRSYMIKTYGDIAVNKFAQVEAIYGNIDDANLTTEEKANIGEEFMTAVVELSRRFDLKSTANKTILGKVFNRFNKIDMEGANTSEIKNGKDVLAAIESFNAAFDKGVITGLAAKVFKGEVKARLAEFKQKQEGTQFSMSKSAERAKAQLEKMQEEGYDANSYELYEALQGMVGAQLSKYQAKGLQITDEEEAVSDVVSRLYTQRDVNKFDGRGTLYGYLNGRIKFRILDAFKANPVWVESFENIDVEGLEGKATRQVATEETETEIAEPMAPSEIISDAEISETVENRPEYKDLLRRRVVEEDVVKAIEEKVLKTVRLLKSRIDANVSKNVTVVPIIREIKKEMGKQADIDFKKAMGGKKDGELRKFLLRNKAAILENMSTTWLSTAMPIAIQKKVDGVWTSDWKGKKIDRESTATDKAGRTSGAELVRRLPNPVRNISDADFLATILQEDGNPIRGKKESLAKAMAEEISFDIIKKALQDSNSPIAQALIENQKRLGVENAENLGPEFVRLSERGNVKFSKGLAKDINQLLRDYDAIASRQIKLELVEDQVDNLLSKYDVFGIYNVSNLEEAKLWVADIKKNLIPLMPKDFWFKEGNINSLIIDNKGSFSNLTKENFESIRELINTEIRDAEDAKFGDPVPGINNFNPQFKRMNKGPLMELNFKNILFDQESAEWAVKSGTMLEYNRYAETVHRALWTRIYNKVREDKNNARGIATWLASSTNSMNHPHRNMISIGGWSANFTRSDVTLEHATPNVAVLQALLDKALSDATDLSIDQSNQWELYYDTIASNYKLIALNKSDDNKAGKYFRSKMSANYDILTGTWWDRYFNLYTSGVEGYTLERDENGKLKRVYDGTRGIDPKTIVLPSGKTLFEVTGIDKMGSYRFNRLLDIIEKIESKFPKSRFKPETRSIAAKFKAETEAWENGKRKYSKGFPPAQVLNNQFNKILERKSGIDASTEFSRIRGQLAGKGKGKYKFFVAPGAEDFRGLVHYAFAGTGKQGEKDMEFFEKNLMEPYFKAIAAIDSTRQIIKREFKTVTNEYKEEYKMLSEGIEGTPFTYDHALRVYLWASQGTTIPGLSATDQSLLENTILDNPALADLGEALMIVGRKDTWPKPTEFWEGDSVLADLNSMTEKIGRKEILSQFIENAEAIFSPENLNKIEAIKGRAHREAIEDSLYSMKNGTNRPSGANQQMNKWLNWINGSTGAIMFFNRRSALLQMLSATNFINWSDNNPVKAAAAFANQAQYWKDFVYIFNSDKLKERRGGLKQDVSESEIAQVAGKSKNSPQAILAYLLKIGFKPTQIADSLAISMGGATFYRNRVNTYIKQGLTQKAAEEKAWLDFSKTSDEAQQSSDPALVSKEQRSVLGRLVLAFANTPMQYTRLMKKAGLDLINNRGDWKTNVSKIAYYGFVQNFIFSALQSALFALAFDSDEEEEKVQKEIDRKVSRTIQSMIDTVVRGSGIYGAIAVTIKNTIMQYYAQEEKGYMADHTYTVLSAVGISPPIGSKLRKLYGAIQTKKFEKDNVAARGWALTADGRLNLGPNWAITGQVVSGAFNVPLDRVVDELKSISEALDSRNKAWQRIALALGWKTWDVGARNEEADLIKTEAKARRKKEGVQKARETRKKKIGSREDRRRRATERRRGSR